jgi:hypothetical protein
MSNLKFHWMWLPRHQAQHSTSHDHLGEKENHCIQGVLLIHPTQKPWHGMQLLFYYLLAPKVALKPLNDTCSSHMRWISHRPMGCVVSLLLGWMRSMLVCDISLSNHLGPHWLGNFQLVRTSVGMVLSPLKTIWVSRIRILLLILLSY